MRIRASILFILMAATNTFAAVSISNFTAAQREGSKRVDLYFDADNSDGSLVSVSVLVSNGISQVGTSSFTGDYGGSVSEGTGLHVVWDGAADFNDQVTSNLDITVQISEPFPAGMVRIAAGIDPSSQLAYDYLMDKTEVTKATWDTYVSAGLTGSGDAPSHPVQTVTWFEAVQWCNNRSSSEGLTPAYISGSWSRVSGANGYRLPTEQEWEYAARGGLWGELYPWGSDIDFSDANYYSVEENDHHPDFDDHIQPYTSPAGYFAPNAYGLHDMAGNVYEWCDDRPNPMSRFRKGGSWDSYETSLECEPSELKTATFESWLLGFRTVREIYNEDAQSQSIPFDSRDYDLTVASPFGFPVPMAGISVFAWKSAVTCSVDAAVLVNGTNFSCIGWSGTGSVPMVGSSNDVIVILNDLASSITWTWADEDVDRDGMNDDWEVFYFGDLSQAFTNDMDFDGQDNGSEYIAGTNPTNPASLFALSEQVEPGKIIIEWTSASNRIYNLYWTEGLQYYSFQSIETNIAFPRNSATATPSKVRGFYKMDVRKD